MTPDEITELLTAGRRTLKGDNNYCHADGEKKHRYQHFKFQEHELSQITAALEAADTVIWRYDTPIQIIRNEETDRTHINIRFAALKDGNQVFILENKEHKEGAPYHG